MSEPTPGRAILSVQSIVKSFGAQPILDNVSMTVHEGDRIGLIGVNGSGKSTLMKIMAGIETLDDGLVTQSQGLRIAMLRQECPLDPSKTVGQVLEDASQEIQDLIDEYNKMLEKIASTQEGSAEYAELQTRCSHLQHELELTDAWNLEQEIKKVSVALNLPPLDRKIDTLSGGELRRTDLAARLIQHPDLLLLDEPTNHIDTKSVEWIENFMSRYEGSCILVTHDRYFLDRVVNRIVELEFNRLFSFPGKYGKFLEYKSKILESEAKAEARRQTIMRRELTWLQRGAQARSTKQKARIDRYWNLEEQGPPKSHKDIEFEIPQSGRLGKIILDADKISFSYGDTVLFKDFSIIMQKGMCVGIVGPNGCGKTTLLKTMMGFVEPDKGKMTFGENTQFLYVDQVHEDIDPNKTILNYVANGATHWEIGGRRLHVSSYLERFLFDKNSVKMPMKNLSGGERNRIDLAKKLLRGGNFLILDEPTNDLDLQTLRVLEDAIENFDGCAMIVSHDRYFLNRLCTHILVFEENGKVIQIAGNYDSYLIYKNDRDAKIARAEALKSKPAPRKSRKTEGRRLTWNEKKEFETIEETILEAESRVSELEEAPNRTGFYEQEHTEVQRQLKLIEDAKHEVEKLYERWQELEKKSGT